MKLNPKMQRGESDAAFCRRMGWAPGTRLAGDEGYGVTVIEITAVGERSILAKSISHDGRPQNYGESNWTLICREWTPAKEPQP